MNKLIKLFATAAVGMACTNAIASSSPYNGFYLGPEGGASLAYFSESSDSTLTVNERFNVNFSLDAPVDSHASNLSGFFGGHVGVGHVFKRFYLGLEANGDLGSVNTTNYAPPTNQTGDLTTSIKDDASIKNNYGVTLRPGFLITPSFLVYAQVGAENAQIYTNTTTTYENVPTQSGAVYSIQSKTNDTELGYRVGLGIEEHASKHLSVRLEYLFTDFGSVSSNNSAPITGHLVLPTSSISESTHFSPFMHSVMLGVSYYV
ncbi:MAG: outer membrane protein [Gammaproteobacteria bacterium]